MIQNKGETRYAVEYNKRQKGGYYFYVKTPGERTLVGVVTSITTTGKVGSVGYWVATRKDRACISDTRKGAVAGITN